MKTTILRTFRNIFQSAALLSLFTLLSFSGSVFAQQTDHATPDKNVAALPAKLKGNIFPSLNPLILKVIFVNPDKEPVTLIVRNEAKEIVYKKAVGTIESYKGKLDISALPDGNYTLSVDGTTGSLSKSFQISTQQARLAQVR